MVDENSHGWLKVHVFNKDNAGHDDSNILVAHRLVIAMRRFCNEVGEVNRHDIPARSHSGAEAQ